MQVADVRITGYSDRSSDYNRLRTVREPLPIDAYIDRSATASRAHRAVVVTAAPGAGKTTRVPPALVDDGPVILLQPRRVAARAIARRIADEQGWTLGQEVGWHIRFERRFDPRTRLLVATEGILTARLQQDPLLSDFRTVVLDEFHERSIHADLGLALARQAWRARDDLRARRDVGDARCGPRVAAFLGDCPVVAVPGRSHSLTIEYAPGAAVGAAVGGVLLADARQRAVLPAGRAGDSPSAAGCTRQRRLVRTSSSCTDRSTPTRRTRRCGRRRRPSRDPRHQHRRDLAHGARRVARVVDTGLQKLPRYDVERGFDQPELERITAGLAPISAPAGRAGSGLASRCGCGTSATACVRIASRTSRGSIWPAPVLDVLAWGGRPRGVRVVRAARAARCSTAR